jgi:hypothetical protein
VRERVCVCVCVCVCVLWCGICLECVECVCSSGITRNTQTAGVVFFMSHRLPLSFSHAPRTTLDEVAFVWWSYCWHSIPFQVILFLECLALTTLT